MKRALQRRGSTLVLVLVVGTLLSLIAFSTAGLATNTVEFEAVGRSNVDMDLRCETAAEALRMQMIQHYEESGLSSGLWLVYLRRDFDGEDGSYWPSTPPPGSPNAGTASFAGLEGVHAWIDVVPDDASWVEIVAATRTRGDGAVGFFADGTPNTADKRSPSSVRLRINIGRNEIFDLVMLTQTTNCMYCHLHINGDIGSLSFFRPGWGSENNRGHNSGNGSRIDGDVYVGTTPDSSGFTGPSDDSDSNWWNDILEDPSEINGADLTGSIFEDYTGPKLPEDTIGNDGNPDFPSFDPAEILTQVRAEGGTLWAGNTSNDAGDGSGTWVVPLDGDWDTDRVTPTQADFQGGGAYQSVVEGNLVLFGTPDNPIQLDGNIYVSGDIIIRGTVQGQGGIYAGRNVYVVGNINYADAPAAGFPLTNDAQGAAAVEDQTSSLRLAARSNVVIGDWTYRNDDGSIARVRDRQGQDFMNAQFGFWQNRYIHAPAEGTAAGDSGYFTSNELTYSDGVYYNDLGEVVPASEVARVDDWNSEGSHQGLYPSKYDTLIAPGQVYRDSDNDPVFDPWISQSEFRQLQGTEVYPAIQWRWNESNNSTIRNYELGAFSPSNREGNYIEEFEQNSDGSWAGFYLRKDGKKALETNVEWQTQVTHIDAFLFANHRIGGKIDEGHLTVNGGLAAREIGVLAVGLRNTVFNGYKNNSPDTIPGYVWDRFNNHVNQYGERTNKTRLHYDFRLRNGGFGFDFFAKTGDLMLFERGTGAGRVEPDPSLFSE